MTVSTKDRIDRLSWPPLWPLTLHQVAGAQTACAIFGPLASAQERTRMLTAIGLYVALGVLIVLDHDYKPRD